MDVQLFGALSLRDVSLLSEGHLTAGEGTMHICTSIRIEHGTDGSSLLRAI